MDIDLAKLGRFVADSCDRDQLRALCQDLGFEYGELLGESRSARAFDLVSLADERGQLSTLLASIARQHPDRFNPQAFESRQQRRPARAIGWAGLAGIGVGALILMLSVLLVSRPWRSEPDPFSNIIVSASTDTPSPPLPSPALPTRTSTLVIVATTEVVPSPTRLVTLTSPPLTIERAMTSEPAITSTLSAAPTSMPTDMPTATPAPTFAPTFTPLPTVTATPPPTPTPVLSSVTTGVLFDPTDRIVTIVPGVEDEGQGRLCTPLHPYYSVEAIYFHDYQIGQLGLSLPAKARVSHTPLTQPDGGVSVQVLEVRRHPLDGFKVTGEAANMLGCDLTLNQVLREALDLPLELGEFNDSARFDHGWITIEFLDSPASTP
jgi:hypothetical protein